MLVYAQPQQIIAVRYTESSNKYFKHIVEYTTPNTKKGVSYRVWAGYNSASHKFLTHFTIANRRTTKCAIALIMDGVEKAHELSRTRLFQPEVCLGRQLTRGFGKLQDKVINVYRRDI